MWTPVSLTRWVFLLTLGIAMLSPVIGAPGFVSMPCCQNVNPRIKERIQECYEQTKESTDCNTHAFVVKTTTGKWRCIDPDSKDLKKRLLEANLKCRPATSPTCRFRVLDEDDDVE